MRQFVFDLWRHDGMHGLRDQPVALHVAQGLRDHFWLMPSTNSLRQRGEAIMVARQRGSEPTGAAAVVAANDGAIYRHARLGGTLNFYYRQAA